MRGPEELLKHENRWETRMGGWFAGERVVYRGQDLHVDLGDMSWMELYLYGITGRRFTPEQLEVLNAIWVYTSYPDPRIWNNRVVALAGTARSTGVLGISAATAVSEASIYGRRPDIRVMDFLVRMKKRLDMGEDFSQILHQELHKYRGIYGYGRPIIKEDERILHMMELAKKLSLDKGFYVALAFEVEKFLLQGKWRLHMNFAALAAAVVADMEFTPREYYLFVGPVFVAGMLPCFIDATEQNQGIFFPLRCNRISYEGVAQRDWGR